MEILKLVRDNYLLQIDALNKDEEKPHKLLKMVYISQFETWSHDRIIKYAV